MILFQFHSGSIQTYYVSFADAHGGVSFNSTLVRFKPKQQHPLQLQQAVSIPLWFDSNSVMRLFIARFTPEFQFHSGSIQTQVQNKCYQTLKNVSIPLWFDSNTHYSEISWSG